MWPGWALLICHIEVPSFLFYIAFLTEVAAIKHVYFLLSPFSFMPHTIAGSDFFWIWHDVKLHFIMVDISLELKQWYGAYIVSIKPDHIYSSPRELPLINCKGVVITHWLLIVWSVTAPASWRVYEWNLAVSMVLHFSNKSNISKQDLLCSPILGLPFQDKSKLFCTPTCTFEVKGAVQGNRRERESCVSPCVVLHILASTPSYYFCHMTRASHRTTHE